MTSKLTTPISKPGEKLSFVKAKLKNFELLETIDIQPSENTFPDFPPAITKPIKCSVYSKPEKLTNEGSLKNSYKFSVKIPNDNSLTYKTGEALGIYVKNDEKVVNYLLERLSLNMLGEKINDPDKVYEIFCSAGGGLPNYIPKYASIRTLLTEHIELRWPALPKMLITSCIDTTKNEEHKLRLKEFASKQYSRTEYMEHYLKNRLQICDFLKAFDTTVVSVSQIINFLPRLKYRWYSACSKSGSEVLEFAFTEARNQSESFSKFGLCTNYLLNLKENDDIYLVQRTSTGFTVPENVSLPIIMVATGTGLAPFLGFLEDRNSSVDSKTDSKTGRNYLYFGCRHPDLDYIYKEKLEKYENLRYFFNKLGSVV